MYPGQFPAVKINLFNVVLALDLSQTSSLHFIGSAVSNIINRQFPFRFGVMPIVETEGGMLHVLLSAMFVLVLLMCLRAGMQMARLFYWLVENVGRAKTMQFIKSVRIPR